MWSRALPLLSTHTGLVVDLVDVEVPRELNAPGLHRPTRRCGLGTRLTPLSVQATASMEQGNIYATSERLLVLQAGSNGAGAWGIYTRDGYGGRYYGKAKE